MLNDAFDGDPGDVRSWPVLDPLAPHARAVAEHADQAGVTDPTGLLMGHVGWLLYAKAQHAEAEPLLRRALTIVEQTLGPDRASAANTLNTLAGLLHDTHRLDEAEELMRRALAIDEQHLGPSHTHVARDLNNLGLLLQDLSRDQEAESLMRRALDIDNQLDPNHPNVARDLNSLGNLLLARIRWGQRMAAAYPYGSQLTDLLPGTGYFEESEQCLRRALAIDEQCLGPHHPNVARDLNNLAQLLDAANRLDEAEPLMVRVVEIMQRAYGEQHPIVATALNNLGQLLRATDRLTDAEPHLRLASAIACNNLGPDHPTTQALLENYARLLEELGHAQPEIEQRLEEVNRVSR